MIVTSPRHPTSLVMIGGFLLGFFTQLVVADGYGTNEAAGGFVKVSDISMYYEVYGEGPPLVLIHGSGQSIVDMAAQIDGFRDQYQIIVADSRAHGKSGMTEQQMTYRQMATDWA